jgi:hyperosmotically inducible periplasmic protein
MRTLSAFLVFLLLASFSVVLLAQPKVSDDLIYDEVRRRLANDMTAQGGGIEVEVKEGVVTLSGKVKNEKQKTRAESLTKKVRGVTKVINKLVIEI